MRTQPLLILLCSVHDDLSVRRTLRSSLWLQAGCSQSLFLRLEARATLDVQEVEGPLGRRELRFSMIESESFKVLPCCSR